MTACLASLEKEAEPEHFGQIPECVVSCLKRETTCVNDETLAKAKTAGLEIKKAVATCVRSRGGCNETSTRRTNLPRVSPRGHGGQANGGWAHGGPEGGLLNRTDLFSLMKSALTPAAKQCFESCARNRTSAGPVGQGRPRGGNGGQPGAGPRGGNGGQQGPGPHGGFCLARFCSCETLRGCREEAMAKFSTIKNEMKVLCSCLTNGNAICDQQPPTPPPCPVA